jgi:hypothetical protein
LGRLGHTGGDVGNTEENNNREEGGEDGNEGILSPTILGNLDNLLDKPTNEVHPRHGGGEGEPSDDSVERLGLKLLRNKVDGLHSFSSEIRHFIIMYI